MQYKEYIPTHIVSVDISGKYFCKTHKKMLISGNACQDEAYHNKQNRGTHSEWSRVVICPPSEHQVWHIMSEGSPGNPQNNWGAGLEATLLVVHLKNAKGPGWSWKEPLVGGCGWGPRWGGLSGQSKAVRTLMVITCSPSAFLILHIGAWSMQNKVHVWE